jgi:hypothetical protein
MHSRRCCWRHKTRRLVRRRITLTVWVFQKFRPAEAPDKQVLVPTVVIAADNLRR